MVMVNTQQMFAVAEVLEFIVNYDSDENEDVDREATLSNEHDGWESSSSGEEPRPSTSTG